MARKANSQDPTLPNWQKNESEWSAEGWEMIDGDPTHWKNSRTGQVIKGRDYVEPKK